VEEDPETILNVGSGDESDGEQSPQLNNSIEESVHSPSVSPASEDMQPTSTTSSSQLQLTYSEPVHTTLTNGLHAPAESPAEHNSLQSIPEEQIQHQQQHPPAQHPPPPPSQHQQQQKNQPTSENLDDMIVTSPTPLSQSDPLMRDQELRLQLYHMKRHYERMRSYFDGQLNSAQIQIDEQHLHIQQLETALGITRHTVKPSTIHNPRYLCTTSTPYNGHFLPLNNNNNSSSSNRSSTTSQHRLMTQQQQQQPMEYMPLKTSPVHSTNPACGDYNFNYLPPVDHEQNVHTPPSWLHNTFLSNSLQQRRDSIPAAMNMTDPTMVVAAGSNSTTRSTPSSIRSTMISPQGSNNNVSRMDPSSVDLSEPLQFESKYSSGCRF
jgi:hypothetical protein